MSIWWKLCWRSGLHVFLPLWLFPALCWVMTTIELEAFSAMRRLDYKTEQILSRNILISRFTASKAGSVSLSRRWEGLKIAYMFLKSDLFAFSVWKAGLTYKKSTSKLNLKALETIRFLGEKTLKIGNLAIFLSFSAFKAGLTHKYSSFD